MGIEIRPATADELLDMGRIAAYVYAGSFGDDPDNVISQSNRPEWTLCAFDGGRMVASFSTFPFTMRAVGNAVPMGGITAVGTLPEYRRQGIVRRIMTQALANMRERGQPLTGLWASQAAIYQRYQFSMTSLLRSYTTDTADIAFHDGNPGSSVVQRVPLSEAMGLVKQLYIEFVRERIGYVHRAAALWQNTVLRPVEQDGPIHVAVCRRDDGTPNGYLVYTLRSGRTTHRSREQEMRVRELIWLDMDAYRSLWSFVARHDLVGAVRFIGFPMDDPAPELFMEPRLLHQQDLEGHWSRVIDVEAALAARGYIREGNVTIGIAGDDLAPWNNGVYALDASPSGATVKRIAADPEIRTTVKALVSLYYGFRSARELASWGMLEGDAESISRTGAIFETPHKPHNPDHY